MKWRGAVHHVQVELDESITPVPGYAEASLKSLQE